MSDAVQNAAVAIQSAAADAKFYESKWFFRRIMVFAIVISSLIILGYLAVVGTEATRNAIVNVAAFLIGGIGGSYLGFATFDDRNAMRLAG